MNRQLGINLGFWRGLTLIVALSISVTVVADTKAFSAIPEPQTATLVVGAGCFWGVEKRFEATPGVTDVIAGYAGGKGVRPVYR